MKTARLLLAALLAACVPAAPRRPTVDLAFMRARAARRPDDAQARRDRALAELVAPGGDLAFAERELPGLPPDARVWFARGLLASQRGDFDGALAAYVAAVRAARDVDDPAGGAVAEAAVPKIISLRGDVRDAGPWLSRPGCGSD